MTYNGSFNYSFSTSHFKSSAFCEEQGRQECSLVEPGFLMLCRCELSLNEEMDTLKTFMVYSALKDSGNRL